MNIKEKIEIPLSKMKLGLAAIGSIIFVAVCACFGAVGMSRLNSIFLSAVGVSGVVFFSLIFAFALKKLLDQNPGIIITREGIIDNSSSVTAGLIQWSEIKEISIVENKRGSYHQGQRFLVIHVRNPKKYMNKGNLFQRLFAKLNYAFFDSPIYISAISLKINLDRLLDILEKNLKKYGDA